jgi:hypothetical protein
MITPMGRIILITLECEMAETPRRPAIGPSWKKSVANKWSFSKKRKLRILTSPKLSRSQLTEAM